MRRSHKVFAVIVSFLLWSFALAFGGELLVFLAYAALLFWAVPLLHGLAGLLFLRVGVTMPTRKVTVGERVSISYSVENRSALAFPCLAIENLVSAGGNGEGRETVAFSIAGKEKISWQTSVECRRRGVYNAGGVRLAVRNIYGVGEFRKVYSDALSLTVYPRVLKLRALSIGATRQSGEILVTDPLCRDPSEISDLGLWKPADGLKRMHWKASARAGAWLSKNFEKRGDSELILLVDACSADYRGDVGRRIEDAVVSVAASVCDFLLSRSVETTLHILGGGSESRLRGSTPADLPSFLEALASFSPSPGPKSFSDGLGAAGIAMRDGVSVFVIGPRLDKPVALQAIRLKMNNRKPKFVAVGRWAQEGSHSEIATSTAKVLVSEGIPVYLSDCGEDARETI